MNNKTKNKKIIGLLAGVQKPFLLAASLIPKLDWLNLCFLFLSLFLVLVVVAHFFTLQINDQLYKLLIFLRFIEIFILFRDSTERDGEIHP